MTQVLQPDVSVSLASADREVENTEQRILVVGSRLAGSAVSGALVEDIGGDAAENALFGRTSHISTMLKAIKRAAPEVRVDAIGVPDGTTKRVFSFDITGTSTAAGTIVVTVASDRHKFTVDIPSGTTAAAAAALIRDAINADLDCPYTAAVAVNDCEVTADSGGTPQNLHAFETTGDVPGLTFTQSETTAGAGDDASIAAALFDVIADKRYQHIVWGWPMTLAGTKVAVLRTLLDARFNVTNRVMDGVGYCHSAMSLADTLTELALLNSNSIVVNCDKYETEDRFDGPAVPEMGEVKSARFAAIAAKRLTPDSAISQYVTTSATRDQFGGPALASLPYFNTRDPEMPLVKTGRGWTMLEIEDLHDAGGYVFGINSAGNAGIVGEVPTTYKNDPGGNADITWKYLNYVHTSSGVREYFFNNLRKRFAQSRLTAGPVTRGRDMVNEQVFRAYCELLYVDLSGPNYVLTQDGEVALNYFKRNLDVSLDLALGKITATMFVPIVTQARTIIATIKISFSTEG